MIRFFRKQYLKKLKIDPHDNMSLIA
jgi:preprotein translocase subunit Sec61beta